MVGPMRAAVVSMLLVACGDSATTPPAPIVDVSDPIPYVDPRIGTGGLGYAFGSCFVGAVAPHGLVKLGPDTSGPFGVVDFLHYSGYWAGDDRIQGFSHLHLHGAGATDYGVLSVMPTLAFDPAKTSVVDYQARFDKANEIVAAGKYQVTFANGISAELAATQRAGVHRYTLPQAGAIVIDLAKALSGGSIDDAAIALAGNELSGHLHHVGGMSNGFGGYTIYFAITPSQMTGHTLWAAAMPPSTTATSATGTAVGAAIAVPAGITELAVGISFVSIAGARANLAAEVGAKSFDAVVAAAQAAWREKLATVAISATEVDARIFYTSLYHAFLMPSVIDDVDGSYQLAGRPVAHAVGYHQMSDMSLWDTYRTVGPLYGWLAPSSARDQAHSLLGFGDGLGSFPRWPIAIGESGTMIGASAEIIVADAVARGHVAMTELGDAYAVLRAAAIDSVAPVAGRGGRGDVQGYLTLGYAPRDQVGRSVSVTTEYAQDDFALAQLATAAGHPDDAALLVERSHGWRKLFDPSVGFLRGKNADGSFSTVAFDALSITDDYAEANAWQSLWMAGIDDPDGIAQVFGGAGPAIDKLSMFFDNAKTDWDTADPSAANFPRPYYWHGNEPDLNAAALFAQLGRPDLAQQWTRWIEDTMYSDQVEGVAGNDDGGTLGSWFVLNALGLYPIAGTDGWIVVAPRFGKATITVNGHSLQILSEGTGMYVQSVDLDGAAVSRLSQAQLETGGRLHFVMGSSPAM